jgi:hypothetical protein
MICCCPREVYVSRGAEVSRLFLIKRSFSPKTLHRCPFLFSEYASSPPPRSPSDRIDPVATGAFGRQVAALIQLAQLSDFSQPGIAAQIIAIKLMAFRDPPKRDRFGEQQSSHRPIRRFALAMQTAYSRAGRHRSTVPRRQMRAAEMLSGDRPRCLLGAGLRPQLPSGL